MPNESRDCWGCGQPLIFKTMGAGRFAHTVATAIRASVLDCASPLALFHRLPIRAHLKFIRTEIRSVLNR